MNTTLKNTGDSLVLDLSLRGGDVVSKLEQTGARITETIVAAQQAGQRRPVPRERRGRSADVIGNRGDAVREMLAARLQSFEDMFNHGGAELAERIARDSTTLGNLITRHLGRVRPHREDLWRRDGRAARRAHAGNLQRDARLSRQFRHAASPPSRPRSLPASTSSSCRFRDALDGRTQTLNEALGARVMDIAKTMAEGGKEVVGALDKRIADVTAVINVRGAKLAESIGAKIDDIDKALGVHAMEVAENLDTRIGRFEELLIGRAETVTKEIETRSQSAADLLGARTEQLSGTIRTSAGEAAQALEQLTTSSTEIISTRVEQLSQSIKTTTSEAERSISSLDDLGLHRDRHPARAAERGDQDQHQRSRAVARAAGDHHHEHAIRSSAQDAERMHHRHVDRREQRAQAECRRGRAHAARASAPRWRATSSARPTRSRRR